MPEQKTKPHTGDVGAFLAQVEDPIKRADSHALVAIMEAVSGTMVGFGAYHYRYATGNEGDAFLIGFAPRKAEFSIYLMGCYFPDVEDQRQALLARLGKHRMGKACLYVKRLSDIDMDVLRELASISVARLRAEYPGK
jgi:hypothetical protein